MVNEEKDKTNNEKKELNRSSVGHLIKLLGVRGNLHLRKSQKIMKLGLAR